MRIMHFVNAYRMTRSRIEPIYINMSSTRKCIHQNQNVDLYKRFVQFFDKKAFIAEMNDNPAQRIG